MGLWQKLFILVSPSAHLRSITRNKLNSAYLHHFIYVVAGFNKSQHKKQNGSPLQFLPKLKTNRILHQLLIDILRKYEEKVIVKFT